MLPPAAPMQTPQASLRANEPEDVEGDGDSQHPEGRRAEGDHELVPVAREPDDERNRHHGTAHQTDRCRVPAERRAQRHHPGADQVINSIHPHTSPPGRSLHWVGDEPRARGSHHLDLYPLRGDRLLRARGRAAAAAHHLGPGERRSLLPELPPRDGRARPASPAPARTPPRRSCCRCARRRGSSSRSGAIPGARTIRSPRPAAPPPSRSARRGPGSASSRTHRPDGSRPARTGGPATVVGVGSTNRVPERFRFLPHCAPNAPLVGVTGSPTQRVHKELAYMSSESFADLGVSRPVVGALAERGIHRTVRGPETWHRGRPRRPRRPRPVADRVGQDARLRHPDGRAHRGRRAPPRGPRPRADPRARRADRRRAALDRAVPSARRSPPSTAASASRRRRRRPRSAHIVVATPGRLEDLLDARRLHPRSRSASSSSTRPTGCSTWASSPRSTGSSPRCRAIARRCSSRRRSRARPASSPPPTPATRGATSTRRRSRTDADIEHRFVHLDSRGQGRRAGRGAARHRARPHPGLRPHQARRRPARQAARPPEGPGGRDARQQVPEPAPTRARRLRARRRATPWSPPTSPPAGSTSRTSPT